MQAAVLHSCSQSLGRHSKVYIVCIPDVCVCVCERETETESEKSFPQSSADMVVMGTNEHGVPANPPHTQTPCLPGCPQDLTLKTALQRLLPLRPAFLEIPASEPKNSEEGDWGKMGCGGNQGTVRHGVTFSRCPMRKWQRTDSIWAPGCRVHSWYPLLFGASY